jgi:hypothetical protein
VTLSLKYLHSREIRMANFTKIHIHLCVKNVLPLHKGFILRAFPYSEFIMMRIAKTK